MRRVVITGLGIVSPIGCDKETVISSLKTGKSGISYVPEYAAMGFRSHVHGAPNIDIEEHVDKRVRRFMGDGAAWNYIAMNRAIQDAGLEESDVSNDKTGLIMGSGGPSTRNLLQAHDITREKGPKKMGPFMVPRTMSSTNSATLATPFKIRGVNYSITSACSTSSHCIGNSVELIQWGKQDVMFAGGGEELDWTMTCMFDAMGALSSKYNDSDPAHASRAFSEDRDGFVIAGGAGVVVLEELERAKARGARIYAEVTGYGATSDGYDMVQPSGEGAVRCMQQAISTLGERKVDYVNAHGTSTPVGDVKELQALKDVFGENVPKISSTKSITGHSLGATGVQETIYSLLMLEHDFIAPSAHITTVMPEAEGMPIVTECIENAGLNTVISNSFGFGGTNATLALSKLIQ